MRTRLLVQGVVAPSAPTSQPYLLGYISTIHKGSTAPTSANTGADAAVGVHPTSGASEIHDRKGGIRKATSCNSVLHHLASDASLQNSPLATSPYKKELQCNAPLRHPKFVVGGTDEPKGILAQSSHKHIYPMRLTPQNAKCAV